MRPSVVATTPPRLVVALALVAAAAATLMAVLVTFAAVSLDGTGFGTGAGIAPRINIATQYLDPGILVALPLAVLLARLVEPSVTDPAHPATRTVLVGAAAVGSALTFFAVLRLVAGLLGGGSSVPSRAGFFSYDLAGLLIAAGGAYWGGRELQRRPLDPPASGADPTPPPLSGPPGLPPGPPTSPRA